MLETASDASTNAWKNVTFNGSCDKQNISLMIGTYAVVHYDFTLFPAIIGNKRHFIRVNDTSLILIHIGIHITQRKA